MLKCPTCDREIDQPPDDGLIFSQQQSIIYRQLLTGPKRTSQLVDAVYANDRTGGPLDARHIIYTQVSRMNLSLREKGILIRSHGGGPGSDAEYKLVEIKK